jgi:signal transduction histidine kinase
MTYDLEKIVEEVIERDSFLKIVQQEDLTSSLDYAHGRDAHISYIQAALDVSSSSLDEDHPLRDRERFVTLYSNTFNVDKELLCRDIFDPGDFKDRHINRWIYHSFMDFALGISQFEESEKFYRNVSQKCFSEEDRNKLVKGAKLATKAYVLKKIGGVTNNYTKLTPVKSKTVKVESGKRRTVISRETIQEHVDELVEIFGREIAKRKLNDNLIFTEEAYQTLRKDIFGLNDSNSSLEYLPEYDESILIDRGKFEFTYESSNLAQFIDWINGWNIFKLRRENDSNRDLLFSYSTEIAKKTKIIEHETEKRVALEGEVKLAKERERTAIAEAEAEKAEQAYQSQITSTTKRFGELSHIGHDGKHHLRTITAERKKLLEKLILESGFNGPKAITGPTGYLKSGLQGLVDEKDAPTHMKIVARYVLETETYLQELRENSELVMAGGFSKNDETVGLKNLLDKAVKAAQSKYVLEINYNIDESVIIQGDSKQLSTCFANILNNAGEVSRGGYINISVRQKQTSKGAVITAVQLEQSGYMSEEIANRLNKHEKFTTKEDGEGLGSQAIYRILENHKGSIIYSASASENAPAKIRVLLK